MLYKWKEFLEEGDELYSYMIHNFEEMFDGDSIIKHFDVRDFYCNGFNHADIIIDKYYTDIQTELILWIKKEYIEGRLVDKTQWKPFRDYDLIEMYHGYKKLFQYKQYYFQLGMETLCMIDNCIYCNPNSDTDNKHFILEIYGWKETEEDILYPYRYTIPSDNIMPEKHWEIK
jgi:hypothetical protein